MADFDDLDETEQEFDEELEALDDIEYEDEEGKPDEPGVPPKGSLDSLLGIEDPDEELDDDSAIDGLFGPDE